MGGRSYRPLIPLFCLVWDSSIGVAARIPRVRRAASPPWYRRARRARCKARQRLKCGIGTAQDRILLLHHHGSMAPKPASGTKETKPQKGKGRGEELQQNRIHFGLPQSVVQALQSIATRATQDLWSPTIAAAADATAEQGLQRRTNTTNRRSKRLAGNLRAKEELGVALQQLQWFVLIGQHMLGLLSQVRGLGQKFDEDIVVAAQEMREILAGQPSDATASLVDRALSAAGPIWSIATCGGTPCLQHGDTAAIGRQPAEWPFAHGGGLYWLRRVCERGFCGRARLGAQFRPYCGLHRSGKV